jgi:hypothetical protein
VLPAADDTLEKVGTIATSNTAVPCFKPPKMLPTKETLSSFIRSGEPWRIVEYSCSDDTESLLIVCPYLSFLIATSVIRTPAKPGSSTDGRPVSSRLPKVDATQGPYKAVLLC